jgi:hypothetical protein
MKRPPGLPKIIDGRKGNDTACLVSGVECIGTPTLFMQKIVEASIRRRLTKRKGL